MESFFLIGSVQSIFFTFLLAAKRDKRPHDWILGVWLAAIAFHLFSIFCAAKALYVLWPLLLYFSPLAESMIFVHGPALFLYTQYLISKKRGFSLPDALHFGLFFLSVLSLLVIFLGQGAQLEIFLHLDEAAPTYYLVSRLLFAFHGPLYIVLTFLVLSKHNAKVREKYSYTESIDLKWLRNIAFGLSAIWFLVLLQWFVQLPFSGNVPVYIGVTLFVFFLGFMGLRHGDIFSEVKTGEKVENKTVTTKPDTYKKSSISSLEAKRIAEEMERLLNEERFFLKSRLALYEIAKALDVSSHTLSQVLNKHLGTNFFDYINSYRVEEAKKLLVDSEYDSFTLLAIALESGFNSKSSFNRIFKKHVGMTPSEYKTAYRKAR